MRRILAIDMDGVTVNLRKHIQDVTGKDLLALSKEDSKKVWEEEFTPKWFRHAPPCEGYMELIEFGVQNFDLVYFLTALPWHRKDMAWQCMEEKQVWTRKHVGVHIPVAFGPFAADKQYHCVGSHHFLVDDLARNIEQWRGKGGTGILHTSAQDSIQQMRVILEAA